MLEPSAASDKRARSAAVLKHQRGPGDGDVPKSVVHGRMLLLTPANMVPTPLACSRVRGPMRAGGILIPAPAAAHTRMSGRTHHTHRLRKKMHAVDYSAGACHPRLRA